MTRRLAIGTVLLAFVASVGLLMAQGTPSSGLPALERCQAERLQLQATVVQLRADLVARETDAARVALEAERQRLEQRFRELLTPAADATFNWTTLTFTAPPAVPK